MTFLVERDECRLYATIKGSGPLMLLVHGVACNGSYFFPAMEILSRSYTTVAYDRRGYSQSTADEEADYSIAAQADDAAAVICAAGLGAAAVVGSSAGGLIALELARRHPELVTKLFLQEPPLASEPMFFETLEAWVQRLGECAKKKRMSAALLTFVRAIGGKDGRAPSQPLEEQAERLKNLEVFMRGEMFELLAYLKALPEKLDIKVMRVMAVGEMDADGLFSKWGESGAAWLECRLLHAPGYHNLPSDLPLDFAALVLGAFAVMDDETEERG